MITPADQEKVDIIHCLEELHCCPRCILRYIGVRSNEMYLNPENTLNTFLKDGECKGKLYADLQVKRIRQNPCRACLDIFRESTIETYVNCISSTNISEYNYSDFVTSVSFPKSILIRNHSIFIYLKEKFPHIYNDLNGLENLRKVFRTASSEVISLKINKRFSSNSNFNLIFEIQYEDDELEIQNIKNINYLNKRYKQQDTSRNAIVDILEKCEDKLFKEQFLVPPKIPNKKTKLYMQCMAEPMWIGGRYLKFSRNMGQTPWIINDKLVTEHCLQDILFENMEKILGCDRSKLTFSASGREDADVRMLGNGRPFYIQIDDPKDRSIPFEKYRNIEIEIFKTKMAAVVKLQEISRNDIKRIKDGEQYKRKHYYVLCQVNTHDNITDLVNKINAYNSEVLEIHQKTPLRVLHRRTQAVRQKYIYRIHGKIIPGHSNLFEIKVVTQAGTYVKEFITGDFQRTQPSLSSILQFPVDVVALDVVRIELTWPEEETETV